MKHNCNIVRDLLPLYADGVCSDDSAALVKEHLDECPECATMLERMRSDSYEDELERETKQAIRKQEKILRNRSMVVGGIISCVFSLPILICLIVNLAVSSNLSWFFIVLASLLCAASLTVVPLLINKYRFPITFCAFAASLTVLLATCALYTHEQWFFVAESAVIFGLAVVFLPILVQAEPLKTVLGKHRLLAVLGADTFFYALMIAILSLHLREPDFTHTAIACSLPPLVLIWAVLLTARYLGAKKRVRLALISIFIGIFVFCGNTVIGLLLSSFVPLPRFSPLCWDYGTISENVLWFILLISLLTALILLVTQWIRDRKDSKHD